MQVDSSSCSVILDQLGSFVLMGESAPPRTAGKRLRLATFGPALRFNMDYTVKVYVTDDTPDAIEVSQIYVYVCNTVNLFLPTLLFDERLAQAAMNVQINEELKSRLNQ